MNNPKCKWETFKRNNIAATNGGHAKIILAHTKTRWSLQNIFIQPLCTPFHDYGLTNYINIKKERKFQSKFVSVLRQVSDTHFVTCRRKYKSNSVLWQ